MKRVEVNEASTSLIPEAFDSTDGACPTFSCISGPVMMICNSDSRGGRIRVAESSRNRLAKVDASGKYTVGVSRGMEDIEDDFCKPFLGPSEGELGSVDPGNGSDALGLCLKIAGGDKSSFFPGNDSNACSLSRTGDGRGEITFVRLGRAGAPAICSFSFDRVGAGKIDTFSFSFTPLARKMD